MLILDLDGSLVRSDDIPYGRHDTAPPAGRMVLRRIGSSLVARLRTYVMTVASGLQRYPRWCAARDRTRRIQCGSNGWTVHSRRAIPARTSIAACVRTRR